MSRRRNWDSPNPSLASECAPPPRTGDSPAGEGLGGVPIPTTGESLALCVLCDALFPLNVMSTQLEPEFVNIVRSPGIDSQPGGIDSL